MPTASNENLNRIPKVQDSNLDGVISAQEAAEFGGREGTPSSVTAKQNFTAIRYGTDKGTLRFGHIHKKGDVTSGAMLEGTDGRHQFSLDVDGQRKNWTSSTSPGNFQVMAGEDNEEADDTLILNAINGNICITALNGKIRLQGTDIELVAVGEGGSKGHIKCTATETFTIHETKKIILDSKSLTKITTTGIMWVAANSCMKIYSSIIRGVTDAVKVKDSKVGGQRFLEENNVV